MPVIYDNSVNEMNTLRLPTLEDIDDEPVRMCACDWMSKREEEREKKEENEIENCISRPSTKYIYSNLIRYRLIEIERNISKIVVVAAVAVRCATYLPDAELFAIRL